MIYLTNDEDIKEVIENKVDCEINIINLMIESQNIKKNILSDAMQRFANYAEIASETSKVASIAFFLNNFKNSLALSKTNIYLLSNLLDDVNEIKRKKNSKTLLTKIEKYNLSFNNVNEIVFNNTIQIENTLKHILSFSEFTFNAKNMVSNITDSKDIEISLDNKVYIDEKLISEFNKEKLQENTLIVSEKEGVVVLPFFLQDLNKIYRENNDKYKSFKEIVDEKYTVPFNSYKNPAISRFREAFKLMKIKEKASLRKAFELGMELFFNYNLHPAIITACKNLDELDIYLDYLEDNETHKFDCFKIIFDMAPIEVKTVKFGLKNKKSKDSEVLIENTKETVEEILGVELESKTLNIEDIKEEVKVKEKNIDIEVNASNMNIKELEKSIDINDNIEKIIIPNDIVVHRNEDYDLVDNKKENKDTSVDLVDDLLGIDNTSNEENNIIVLSEVKVPKKKSVKRKTTQKVTKQKENEKQVSKN